MTIENTSGPWALPPEPKLTTQSERDVWERLREQLPPGAYLISNLRLSEEMKNHELDFVVLLPGQGVVVLEVKGSGIRFDDERGWVIPREGRVDRIDPVNQVRQAMYAARTRVQRDPRWGSRPQLRWAHGLVTPYSAFDHDFEPLDLPRWMLHDRDAQPKLVERLGHQLARTRHDNTELPYGDDLKVLAEIQTRPRVMSHDVLAESEERAAISDQLTMEQAVLLGATRLLRRVEVRGGAGSGKTACWRCSRPKTSRGVRVAARPNVWRCCATRSGGGDEVAKRLGIPLP